MLAVSASTVKTFAFFSAQRLSNFWISNLSFVLLLRPLHKYCPASAKRLVTGSSPSETRLAWIRP